MPDAEVRDPLTESGTYPTRHEAALSKRSIEPARLSVVVGLIGTVLSAVVAWGVHLLDERSEHEVLQVQSQQIKSIIASSIVSITNPMNTALQLAEATDGNERVVANYLARSTGPRNVFISAALVSTAAGHTRVITAVGVPSWLDLAGRSGHSLLHRASRTSSFLVRSLHHGANERIGYVVADHAKLGFAVYAERAIPADREVTIEHGSAFSDLNFATYVGPPREGNLATTDVSPTHLPLSGYVVAVRIPFGDTAITLDTTAREQLIGAVASALPWIFLSGGLLISFGTALLTDQLATRRRRAEQHATTVTELYRELNDLYGQQRTIAGSLQRALLPAFHPVIAGLEVSSRYVAGANGVDIGGDWYSVIELPNDRFGFVVGDVSGRGISAATLMARIRFTIDAYLLEGHAPAQILTMCANHVDIERDGHIATVLVGVGDTTTGTITFANAGHLNPLLCNDDEVAFCQTAVGTPLGTGFGSYEATTVTVPPGALLLGFTDGLVERRGEDLQIGLDRLATTAASARSLTLEETLTSLVEALVADGAEDDVAIVAVQRRSTDHTHPAPATAATTTTRG